MAVTNIPARDYTIFGTGYGLLKCTSGNQQNQTLGLIKSLRDQGQEPLGQPIPIQTINDYQPTAIVPPQAVGVGKMSGEFFALRNQGFFASLFNGAFPTAKNLVDVLRQELAQGAMTLEYAFLDATGQATKVLLYQGVVITSALRSFSISAENGASVASFYVDMEYTGTIEQSASN
ncbi:MAG: hypothetical protein IIY98_03250 [Aeriscardovia sp.]|nr:hypothetical protein [Aeriscardovia sp.]